MQMNISEDSTVLCIRTYVTPSARLHELALNDDKHHGFFGGAVEHKSCRASILLLEGL